MEMEMVGLGWRGLSFSGFGQGGDRWLGWVVLLPRWNRKSTDSGVLSGGKLSFPSQLNTTSFLNCLVDRDSDWALIR